MVKSDWEGPWVTADHAYEVTKRGIPNGDKLFAGISEYDDYLAYIRRKKGYEPGDTLVLITPFLIAYDLSDSFLVSVAKDNANFIKGSLEAIKILDQLGYSLKIISTSYCQYVYYTTKLADIPTTNIKCTYFPIDKYSKTIKERDKEFVKTKIKDIINLPRVGISASTTENELSTEALKTVELLDNFFWKELPETTYKRILEEVRPLGGNRKFTALKQILEEEGKELHESETIGDSITDWIMLRETRDAGGLAVSFNGNDYAVRNANVAIISDNCMIIPIIIDLFRRSGIEKVEEITSNWSYETIKNSAQKSCIKNSLFKQFTEFLHSSSSSLPEVTWVTEHNLEVTIERSKKMRNEVRGIAIGSLG